ncbi:MAG: sulfite reductase flavoprotein subunit alpha [Pseudomonadota bacterium]
MKDNTINQNKFQSQSDLPFLPSDTPFSNEQKRWLGGFFAGLHSRLAITQENVQNVTAQSVTQKPLTIIYGSQTGNAESVAEQASEAAAEAGLAPTVYDMDDVSLEDLAKTERLLLVTSTYGEGEMPDNAQALWDSVESETAPRFDNTHFSVLALGDTNYDGFCVAGKLWDKRLEELGAKRISDRVDCDVEYESLAKTWIDTVLPIIFEKGSAAAEQTAKGDTSVKTKKTKAKFNRQNPLMAKLKKKVVLTGDASSKQICHFEFSLQGSGEQYKAGDILNITPKNRPDLVSEILQFFNIDCDAVAPSQPEKTVEELLLNDLEIRAPSKELIAEIAKNAPQSELARLSRAEFSQSLDDYLYGKDVIDLLIAHPGAIADFESLVPLLKPLSARAYSISSSLLAHDDEVHLTIGSVRYHTNGREHNGVCSTYLADLMQEDEEIACYFSANKHFAIPDDGSTPIIMVGPGTGIAPFRAFLEERQAKSHNGPNWLFFGDRNKATDFIYQDEIEQMHSSGFLTRLDLAFSRDQAEKIYVQNLMWKNGKELYDWLEKGAYFYVCGDAFRMAKDVDKMLTKIVATFGGMSEESAVAYVNSLKKQKRYVRDVY